MSHRELCHYMAVLLTMEIYCNLVEREIKPKDWFPSIATFLQCHLRGTKSRLNMIAVTVVFCLGICGLIRGDVAVLLSYVHSAYDMRQCHFNDEFNTSADMIGTSVSVRSWSRSVSPTYLPRVLSTGQISWKTKGKSEGSKSSGKDKDKGEPSVEAEAGVSKKKASKNKEYKDEGDVVHRFLAFGLALPQHPFSSELLTALKAVAPLYPDVAVIVGNVEEFADFSSQYNVRSFPKLLLFNWGMLHSRVTLSSTNYSEEELSAHFRSWTGTAPAAAPLPEELRDWSGRREDLVLRNDWDAHGAFKVAVRNSRGDALSKSAQSLSETSARSAGGKWPRVRGKIALSHSAGQRASYEEEEQGGRSDPLYILLHWWGRFVSTFFVDTLEPSMNIDIDSKAWLLSALYVAFRLVSFLHTSWRKARSPPSR